MLSRVAHHLYWMSRYIERAENTARILDVGQTSALLSHPAADSGLDGEPLAITGTRAEFAALELPPTPTEVARFLAWHPASPSSIASCLEASRENARAVRDAMTSEMWESVNETWLQLQHRRRSGNQPITPEFFDWVKRSSHLFRGVTFATARRDQAYVFVRMGTFVERADNTARILQVKQGAAGAGVGRVSEYYRLSSLLRSVSALEAYRDVYQDAVDPRRIAEMLIFHSDLPRSLRFCYREIDLLLQELPPEPGRLPRRLTTMARARLDYGDLDEVYAMGLVAYLERFILETAEINDALSHAYLEPK